MPTQGVSIRACLGRARWSLARQDTKLESEGAEFIVLGLTSNLVASLTARPPARFAVIIWTRMQAEAGQPLDDIVARKEKERVVGGGLFFWGVGNAPPHAGCQPGIEVVFSVMKSKPQDRDLQPSGILNWRTYFVDGHEQPLPLGAKVTSRAPKKAHYALICWSDEPLELRDLGPFDPGAYRNISGAPVGASQVTVLIREHGPPSEVAAYRISMRAELRGWVRLGSPVPVGI